MIENLEQLSDERHRQWRELRRKKGESWAKFERRRDRAWMRVARVERLLYAPTHTIGCDYAEDPR